MKLLAKPIGQSAEIHPQLVVQPTELAELNDERFIDLEPPQAVGIGSKSVGEHLGISAVVLGSGGAEAVPEAVKLFGIDTENGKAALEKNLDQWTAIQLDSDGHLVRFGAQLEQSSSELVHSFGGMLDGKLGEFFALGIEDTDLMGVVCPVDTGEQAIG